MEVTNTFKVDSQEMLLSQDESRFAKKLTFFISLIILFTFIMGSIISVFSILKHNLESQSLSANPTKAIRDVCDSFWYEYFEFYPSSHKQDSSSGALGSWNLCIHPITSLHGDNFTNKINPSMIFHLSLQVAITQVKNLQNESVLEEGCKKLLTETETQLNRWLTSMGVDSDDSVLRDRGLVSDMMLWFKNATVDLETCLADFNFQEKKFGRIMGMDKVESEIKMAKEFLEISLGIRGNVDNIFEMFYPPIGSVLGINFLFSSDTFLSVSLFSIPYLVLIFLFGVLLRLYRHN